MNQKPNKLLDTITSKSQTQRTIAIVDDEPDILELLNVNLTKAGFKVKCFEDADGFSRYLSKEVPDLVILDLMLPDADGFDICKFLKKEDKYSEIPIIMLTARGEETDKVLGLELGADDYVTKPFSPRELVARVKAILRREEKTVKTQKIKIGGILEIDLQKYDTFVSGEKVELTTSEFRILKMLLERRGWVYSREQILDYLGAYDKGVLDRTVDVHIKNLREKLKEAGKLIKNIRGIGYKLEE
ncbi:MAG TPA: response regulator transcription factor [Candidatus Kapabacteria bacterium]|nr:response regulator transcription factor [Candidatus Kapabacteria bacterium]HPO61954.1 response regulator transcription factor [Candidatus Kapabacteria bacterium]